MSNVHFKGSVRVTQAEQDAAFVARTNNGMFEDIDRVGVGVATIDVDAEWSIRPQDVFEGQIEGDDPGTISVSRVTDVQILVSTFDFMGEAADLDYSLTCSTVYIG